MSELRAAYDTASLLKEVMSGLISQPPCWQDARESHNAAGRYVNAEAVRAHEVMERCRDALRGRGRLTGQDIDTRFEVLAGAAIQADDAEALSEAHALRGADREAEPAEA